MIKCELTCGLCISDMVHMNMRMGCEGGLRKQATAEGGVVQVVSFLPQVYSTLVSFLLSLSLFLFSSVSLRASHRPATGKFTFNAVRKRSLSLFFFALLPPIALSSKKSGIKVASVEKKAKLQLL